MTREGAPWRFKHILLIVVGWVVALSLFSVVAANRFNIEKDTAYPWIIGGVAVEHSAWNPLTYLYRWDSYWYMNIATEGYSFDPAVSGLYNVVFFPLYPLLLAGVSKILFLPMVAAGALVSIASLVGACWFLYRLVMEHFPHVRAKRAVLSLLIFPTAIFLTAVYTEALFLFLSVASFYYAGKKKWWVAGLFGGLAALTRINGIILFLPLLYGYFTTEKNNPNKPSIASIFLVPLCTSLYFLYLHVSFGDFLLFFKAESMWGRVIGSNNFISSFATHSAITNSILDIFFLALAITMTVLVWRRLGTSYGLYMLGTIALVVASGSIAGIGRYILILFPMYILAAGIKNEFMQIAWILISTLLFALYSMLFVNGYWAG